MFATFFQAILPGIRDFRTPLVSGFLWLVFIWMLSASSIDQSLQEPGFTKQAYDVLRYAGGGAIVSAAAVGSYVLGVIAVTLGDAASGTVAWSVVRPWGRVQLALLRQQRARRKENELRAALTTADEKQRPSLTSTLDVLTTAGILNGLWIRQTREVEKLIGTRFQGRGHTIDDAVMVLDRAVQRAAAKGAQDALAALGATVEDEFSADGWLTQDLTAQFKAEPLDVLRTVDETAYQSLDRERSEREFRLAVALPAAAISAMVGIRFTPWGYVCGALSLWTFARATAAQSQEAWRVASYLMFRGLPAAVQRDAEATAGAQARRHAAKSAKVAVGPHQ